MRKYWNEYLVGYVLTTTDNKSINVQFELNKRSNHPSPDVIAVIGADGDETIFNFDDAEIDQIQNYVDNDAEIIAVANAMTKIIDAEIASNFYEMSLDEIFLLAENARA